MSTPTYVRVPEDYTTITEAADDATGTNYVILVQPGTYEESIDLGGGSASRLTLRGYPGKARPVIRASTAILAAGSAETHHRHLDYVFTTGGSGYSLNDETVHLVECSFVTEDPTNTLFSLMGSGSTVRRCYFEGQGATGGPGILLLAPARTILFENNVFYKWWSKTMALLDCTGTYNMNTFHGCGGDVTGALDVRGNLAVDCVGDSAFLVGSSTNLFNNTFNCTNQPVTGSNTYLDPLLADPENGQFFYTDTSPLTLRNNQSVSFEIGRISIDRIPNFYNPSARPVFSIGATTWRDYPDWAVMGHHSFVDMEGLYVEVAPTAAQAVLMDPLHGSAYDVAHSICCAIGDYLGHDKFAFVLDHEGRYRLVSHDVAVQYNLDITLEAAEFLGDATQTNGSDTGQEGGIAPLNLDPLSEVLENIMAERPPSLEGVSMLEVFKNGQVRVQGPAPAATIRRFYFEGVSGREGLFDEDTIRDLLNHIYTNNPYRVYRLWPFSMTPWSQTVDDGYTDMVQTSNGGRMAWEGVVMDRYAFTLEGIEIA